MAVIDFFDQKNILFVVINPFLHTASDKAIENLKQFYERCETRIDEYRVIMYLDYEQDYVEIKGLNNFNDLIQEIMRHEY